jgi:predicted lactoylglutathione lyase
LANVFTLGVRDLVKVRAFYQQLGWPLVVNDRDFAAFELRGAVLALFPVAQLAADGRASPEAGQGGIRFTLGIMTDRRDEVDALAGQVRAAGGRLTKEPVDAEFFEGRSAYFADPEGNYWEIAWAPADNPIVTAARRAASAPGPATSRPASTEPGAA